ncbi:DUF1850 domain-containing protein [Paenisporosarcina antarctica]|uniref:DUF1850 domain-containing protein n=1 Tax=Paenisporosarcina antarctica TaxID=417367 RepID=UPI001FBA954A|nr:DUF1850 domain-containing protein [Paenisporosarcina antarctica]
MTNNKRKLRGPFLLVLLFFLLLFVVFPLRFVQITLPNSTLFIYEKTFDVQWIHSVEKEEWIESYRVNSDKFILTSTAFKTFGAGVPSDGLVEIRDDGYVHMTINREMDDILLVVSDLVKTTIYFDTKEILLYELVDDYEEVLLESKLLPWWNILK